MCHVSCVVCHVSPVTCQKKFFIFFYIKKRIKMDNVVELYLSLSSVGKFLDVAYNTFLPILLTLSPSLPPPPPCFSDHSGGALHPLFSGRIIISINGRALSRQLLVFLHRHSILYHRDYPPWLHKFCNHSKGVANHLCSGMKSCPLR